MPARVAMAAHWSVVRQVYLTASAADAFMPQVGFKVLLLGAMLARQNSMGRLEREGPSAKRTFWKTAQRVRAVLAFRSMLDEKDRKNEAQMHKFKHTCIHMPKPSASLSHLHKTAEEVLRASKAFRRKSRKAGVKVELSEEELDAVPFVLQGDAAVETNEARKDRIALRRDPKIKAAILRWWIELGFMGHRPKGLKGTKLKDKVRGILPAIRLVSVSKSTDKSSTSASARLSASMPLPSSSSRGDSFKGAGASTTGDPRMAGLIGIKEYRSMCVALGRALLTDGEEASEVEEEEWRKLADKDWKRDSGGLRFMDYHRFFSSVFELADLHTRGVGVDEYVGFLDRSLARLARPLV